MRRGERCGGRADTGRYHPVPSVQCSRRSSLDHPVIFSRTTREWRPRRYRYGGTDAQFSSTAMRRSVWRHDRRYVSPVPRAASHERRAGNFPQRGRWHCSPPRRADASHKPRSFHAWRLTRRLAAVTALGEGRAVGCELDALAGQFLERLIPSTPALCCSRKAAQGNWLRDDVLDG